MAGEAAEGGLMPNEPRSAVKTDCRVIPFDRSTVTAEGSTGLSDTERALARALANALVRELRAEDDATKAA